MFIQIDQKSFKNLFKEKKNNLKNFKNLLPTEKNQSYLFEMVL